MPDRVVSGALAVAIASTRATGQHMQRAVGGRGRLVVLCVITATVFLAANIAVASFYETTFGMVFVSSELLPDELRALLIGTFVAGTSLTSAALTMLIVMIAPPVSRITVAARIAGMRGATAGVGEFLPQMAALILIVPATGGAAIAVIAAHQPVPAVTALALLCTGVTCALVVLTLRNLVVGIARSARAGDVVARSIGTLVAMVALMVLLADITVAGMEQRASALAAALEILWGEPVPVSLPQALVSVGLCGLSAFAACASALLLGVQQPLAVSWRIVPMRATRAPRAFHRWVAREALLQLRHPVTLVSMLTMTVIIGCASIAARTGALPGELTLVLFAIMCAAGAETARGRVQPWNWVYRSAGVAQRRAVLAQLVALLLVQGVMLVGAVLASMPLESVPMSLVQIVPTFVVLLVLSHLAGAVMPYSDEAPAGALATSALVLTAEIAWLAFDGFVLQHIEQWRLLVQLIVIGAAILATMRVTEREFRAPRAAREEEAAVAEARSI